MISVCLVYAKRYYGMVFIHLFKRKKQLEHRYLPCTEKLNSY